MKKKMLVALIVAFFCSTAVADSKTIPLNMVTVDAVEKSIMDCSDCGGTTVVGKSSEDFAIEIKNGAGMTGAIVLEPQRNMLIIQSIWSGTPKVPERMLVSSLHTFNSSTVFVKAISVVEGETTYVILQYYMTYDGGINVQNLSSSLNIFWKVDQMFAEIMENIF